MSTIRVDNFGPSAGGTTYSARGIAKAWVNFDGTGTIAARDSENVSSLTDNGTGKYEIVVSSAFSNSNYVITTQSTKEDAETYSRCVGHAGGRTKTTTTIAILCEDSATAGDQDNTQIYVVYHGDLA